MKKKLATLKRVWPQQMHIAPTKTAWASMLLCNSWPVTSNVGLLCAGLVETANVDTSSFKTLDDLSDVADALGLEADVLFKEKS